MSDETQVEGVDVSDDGNPLTGVVVSQSLPPFFKPIVIVGTVLTALLAMFSLTIAVTFLAPTVDRLSREQDDQTAAARCRSLYYDDILGTLAESVGRVAVIPQPNPNDAAAVAEYQAERKRRGQDVLDASRALEDYKAIVPPPDTCPHPDWEDR